MKYFGTVKSFDAIKGLGEIKPEAGGDALAAITVDGRLPKEVVDKLRALPEVQDVRQALLD